ncbi:MAG: S8 family serine peptidase [Gammaproteobacteria bacterium]|nr:S8 family serine peptidase [Gammaproteobacteria bacterium]
MLRDHADLVEADPDGDPVVRGQILASFPSEAALSQALALGFSIRRDHRLPALGLHLAVLVDPPHWSLGKSLRALRRTIPTGTFDYDQIYFASGGARAGPRGDTATPASGEASRAAHALPAIGLVDTGIDVHDRAFHRSIVHTWGCGGSAHPAAHGTGVASLLVRRMPAELYAADVYCGAPTGGSADALVGALAWLAQQRVPVINVSLVGPRNLLLARVVGALIDRGYVIVAAVGNDGPAAPPLYPAAYPHVVGVTAVDRDRHVLLEAERGPQVTFAAVGDDLDIATIGDRTQSARGTSFAAPTVAALFAGLMDAPDPNAAAAARATLIRRAIDLGARGWDPIYGYGLLAGR